MFKLEVNNKSYKEIIHIYKLRNMHLNNSNINKEHTLESNKSFQIES